MSLCLTSVPAALGIVMPRSILLTGFHPVTTSIGHVFSTFVQMGFLIELKHVNVYDISLIWDFLGALNLSISQTINV